MNQNHYLIMSLGREMELIVLVLGMNDSLQAMTYDDTACHINMTYTHDSPNDISLHPPGEGNRVRHAWLANGTVQRWMNGRRNSWINGLLPAVQGQLTKRRTSSRWSLTKVTQTYQSPHTTSHMNVFVFYLQRCRKVGSASYAQCGRGSSWPCNQVVV